MSQELERVYTINLGKVLLSPDNIRAKRAINMVREFARHHMKVEDIKIEESLAHHIWSRGIKHPPRKIRVRMTKTDEGFVLVEPFEEEIESVKPEEKKPAVEEKEKPELEETPEPEIKEPKKVPKPEPKKTVEPKKTTKPEPKKTAEPKKEAKAAPKKTTKSASKKKSEK